MNTSRSSNRSPRTATDGYHLPVMVDEVLKVLAPLSGATIVDGTLGGGGHTKAMLASGAKIIGLDQDIVAIGYCIPPLVVYDGDTVRLVQTNFRWLEKVLDELKIEKIDGLLLDLGVSSKQLDLAERGFSFSKHGPLDMRMDRSAAVSAMDVVNHSDHGELTRILREYGEEPAAARIAAAIIKRRENQPFADTLELASLIEKVVPKHGPRHPATRSFQALRIAVNDELGVLHEVLEAAARRLKPGGRMAILTFHSLEDRVVKHFVRETTAPTLDRPEWPAPRPNPRHMFHAREKKAAQASPDEVARNPRARSAKLRSIERNAAPFTPRLPNLAANNARHPSSRRSASY